MRSLLSWLVAGAFVWNSVSLARCINMSCAVYVDACARDIGSLFFCLKNRGRGWGQLAIAYENSVRASVVTLVLLYSSILTLTFISWSNRSPLLLRSIWSRNRWVFSSFAYFVYTTAISAAGRAFFEFYPFRSFCLRWCLFRHFVCSMFFFSTFRPLTSRFWEWSWYLDGLLAFSSLSCRVLVVLFFPLSRGDFAPFFWSSGWLVVLTDL